ncbi:MAG: virulence factor [Candidatus Eremiobacteraeota bacterium]|nr:virulence factor [Candidatus Eremiobacteraeota bacterium]
MYAIAFDLDTEELQAVYPNDSWRNGYKDIRRLRSEEGLNWKQGSVMFGDPGRSAAPRVALGFVGHA